jgi:hypothetical protein
LLHPCEPSNVVTVVVASAAEATISPTATRPPRQLLSPSSISPTFNRASHQKAEPNENVIHVVLLETVANWHQRRLAGGRARFCVLEPAARGAYLLGSRRCPWP